MRRRSFLLGSGALLLPKQTLAQGWSPLVGLSTGQAATLARLQAAAAAAVNNNPVDLVQMASPPTITQNASHDAALTVSANSRVNPTQFRMSPGNQYHSTSSNGFFVGTSNWSPATGTNLSFISNLTPTYISGDEQNCGTIAFDVNNAQKVELSLRSLSGSNTTVPYRIIVNNQFVAANGLFWTAAFSEMDFGSTQTLLHITVEFQTAGAALQSVAVSAGGTITGPVDATYKMLALGDSITEGSSSGDTNFYVFDRWASTFAKQAGFNALREAGVGGTGYVSTGSGRSNLVGQLPYYWAAGDQYDLVVVSMGYNDYNSFQSTLQANALAAFQNIRANQPNALIIVHGIWGESTGPATALITAENLIAAAVTQFNDRFTRFMPISTDPAGAWVTGTGYVGHTTGVGNADTVVSSDGVHPTRGTTSPPVLNQGAVWLGSKVNTAYRAMLPTIH